MQLLIVWENVIQTRQSGRRFLLVAGFLLKRREFLQDSRTAPPCLA